jgi:hypothetical protein
LSGDIISSNILIGKSKQDVIDLFGDPVDNIRSDGWNYSLGHRPELFNIDPSILEIDFKEDKVISVEQHH